MTIEQKSLPVVESVRRQFPQTTDGTLVIKFHRPGMKDIRRDADESYFRPQEGHTIEIVFEPKTLAAAPEMTAPSSEPASDIEVRLVRALHRIASDPRYNFVALKWFRDSILPAEGFTPEEARAAVDSTIAKGWVRVELLANPNSTYATSTLHLNRENSRLQALLQPPSSSAPARRRLAPVRLTPGISAAETVLRGRR